MTPDLRCLDDRVRSDAHVVADAHGKVGKNTVSMASHVPLICLGWWMQYTTLLQAQVAPCHYHDRRRRALGPQPTHELTTNLRSSVQDALDAQHNVGCTINARAP